MDDEIALVTTLMAAEDTGNPFWTADGVARSLNRARIVELPGAPVEAGILGHTAYELLSAAAIESLVRDAAESLGLDPRHPNPLGDFDRYFADPRTSAAAESIAGIAGRRLGALLLMLSRGNPANRAARPDWNDAHWAFWARVRQVILGGGLMAGELGRRMTAEARRFLAASGSALDASVSNYGAHVTLVGLARCAPEDARQMLLFDFGQTNVKRGRAIYRAGLLSRIELAPSLASPDAGSAFTPEAAREQWAAMWPMIAARWEEEVGRADRRRTAIGLALATHLNDGHPFPTDRGRYGRLQLLGPRLACFLRDSLAERLGTYRAFVLLHDGLAAATAYAGARRAAVLTLGTAIGAGYVPSAAGLRPHEEGLALLRDY